MIESSSVTFGKSDNNKILVIGDIFLEQYITGHLSDDSSDQSIPNICKKEEKWLPGGAARLAVNISEMNKHVVLAGVVGMDDEGSRAKKMMNGFGIPIVLCMDASRHTTVCRKIYSDGRLIACIENGGCDEIQGKVFNEILQIIMVASDDIDLVLIADYGKGVVTKELVNAVNQICHNRRVAVYIAADKADYEKYCNVEMIYTDLYVLENKFGKNLGMLHDLKKAALFILNRTKSKYLVVNMGAEGLMLFCEKPGEWICIPFSGNLLELFTPMKSPPMP